MLRFHSWPHYSCKTSSKSILVIVNYCATLTCDYEIPWKVINNHFIILIWVLVNGLLSENLCDMFSDIVKIWISNMTIYVQTLIQNLIQTIMDKDILQGLGIKSVYLKICETGFRPYNFLPENFSFLLDQFLRLWKPLLLSLHMTSCKPSNPLSEPSS